MKRGCALWLVTLPAVLIGVEIAHALGNAIAGAPPNEIFASASTGRDLLPLIGAGLVCLAAAAFLGRASGVWWAAPRARIAALPFAMLPPLGFVLLELAEAAHEGHPGHVGALGAFVAGMALQLPVSLVGYIIVRLLLALTDHVRALVQARRRRRLADPHRTTVRAPERVASRRPVTGSFLVRGPPVCVLRPG